MTVRRICSRTSASLEQDCLNILLIKHDVIGSRRQVKRALLSRGHAVEETREADALAVPAALMAGLAAYPPPEQPRYGYDCEILVGASLMSPQLL